MPRTAMAPIVETEVLPDTITTPHEARAALRDFALANGHTISAFEGAMVLFETLISAQPGEVVTMWRHNDAAGKPAHDAFEDIVAGSAHDLAVIAVGARPGTQFDTQPLPDACGGTATYS